MDAAPAIRGLDDATFQPTTLFLTWHRDPTTTMTVQWVGTKGETSDTNDLLFHAATLLVPGWSVQKTATKPYPMHRLQGLPRRT